MKGGTSMITILSFSGRPDGNSIRVADVVADALGKENTQIIDFSEVNVEPCNHCHCDHIFGNIYFEEAYVHKNDLALANEHSSFPEFTDMCTKYGMTMPPFQTIEHGEIIDLGGATLEVILAPGHTPGSICLLYREERVLFTGDAINCHLWMQLDNSLKIRELADNLEKLLYLKNHADKILHGHAHDYEDISLLQELYEGAHELADHPELSENDPDYHWFGGVAKQHPFGGGNKVICYSLDKLK